MKINCIVVDDEASSQRVLENFIKDIEFLNLVCICENSIEALEKLQEFPVIDLLFLDVNMPKLSGIEMYKSLQNPPHVIFTTAYSKYAVDGFDVNAIDFLLKPFSFERFLNAVNKVASKMNSLSKENSENPFLLIKSNKIIHKIFAEEILFIEALGDYVKIYYNDKYVLTNNTFYAILEMLPKNKFIQSHKSFAVNLDKINTINGNQIAINKHLIAIGLKYKESFFEKFNKQ